MISRRCATLRQSEDLWRRVFESKFGAVVSETKPPQLNFVDWFLTLADAGMLVQPPNFEGDEWVAKPLTDLLFYAIDKGYTELVIYSLKNKVDIHYKNDSALILASGKGQKEIVKLLIANGANVQARDNAALIHAGLDGEDEIVKLLIANGADVQANDNETLRHAAENGSYEIVKLLVNGADVQAKDNEALRYAAENGDDGICPNY